MPNEFARVLNDFLNDTMRKIKNTLYILVLAIGISSCTKDDVEVVRNPLDTTELIGKWAKIERNITAETVVDETTNLDSIKLLEFTAENSLTVTRGNFCNLSSVHNDSKSGSFEYYSTSTNVNGTMDRIKFELCGNGMPVTLQGDILTLGFGGDASERYKRVSVTPPVDPEVPEEPENPEEPTDPGTGG